MQIVAAQGTYQIKSLSVSSDKVVPSPFMDYSTYVIIDNANGSNTLNLVNYKASQGYYTCTPPAQIKPGGQGRFWIQAYAGLYGSSGSVTYQYANSLQQITLDLCCKRQFLVFYPTLQLRKNPTPHPKIGVRSWDFRPIIFHNLSGLGNAS
jgi:hypothetical protein